MTIGLSPGWLVFIVFASNSASFDCNKSKMLYVCGVYESAGEQVASATIHYLFSFVFHSTTLPLSSGLVKLKISF